MINFSKYRAVYLAICFFLSFPNAGLCQVRWTCVDSLYGQLPPAFHVYFTSDAIDTGKFRAYYCVFNSTDKRLTVDVDTTANRRLTPSEFFEKNKHPLVVVNTTFFSFETHHNLNVVIKNGKQVSFNQNTIPLRGKDTFTYHHPFGGAFGIDRSGHPDVAWVSSDSNNQYAFASQTPVKLLKDSSIQLRYDYGRKKPGKTNRQFINSNYPSFERWQMKSAIGGGPVLIQNGKLLITNNEELRFNGKAINDKHPRTCIGYTADNRIIILVIEGRNPLARGATLTQEANILLDLGCVEAMNLDGGGSSCLLINGKPTITVADKTGQRPVPCVLLVTEKSGN